MHAAHGRSNVEVEATFAERRAVASQRAAKIRWTPEAEQDRVDVWDFIAGDNPLAAVRMDELCAAAMRLVDFPQRGRAGKILRS